MEYEVQVEVDVYEGVELQVIILEGLVDEDELHP